ncbi:hypothetical protein SDC9_193921 [bioreactor metagenome]|uniref:Uncharacterized protein n=1 Tax=bioreactor metagenome TaxID=1076179 RepID=A0A645I4V3_9ZZZZ
MLHDHAAALLQRSSHAAGNDMRLRERGLKAHVQVVGVRAEKAALVVHRQNGQRAHVDAVVVVGHLKAREHALDQHALAAARLPHDADQPVKGRQVVLGDGHAHLRHAPDATGREVHAVQVVIVDGQTIASPTG